MSAERSPPHRVTTTAKRSWPVRVSGTVAVVLLIWSALYLWVLDLYTDYREAEWRGQATALASSTASALGLGINQRLGLVRGLAAFVATTIQDPGNDLGKQFPRFATAMTASVPGIRNISVSPSMVVALVYPDDPPNRRVIGNNLLADSRPGFAEAVLRAVTTRDIILHEPVQLIQGSRGLIARQAVFLDDQPWGAVGVVFDLTPLIEASAPDPTEPFLWAVRTIGGTEVAGNPAVFALAPVIGGIVVPQGRWEVAVAPAIGWRKAARAGLGYHGIQAMLVLLGMLATLLAVNTLDRRQQLERQVQQRTTDLLAAQDILRQQARELAQANRELERFAYVAAHDLQEPLRGITCFSQLVARSLGESLDAEASGWLDEVVRAASRMKFLLRDIQLYMAEASLPLPDAALPAIDALEAARWRIADALATSGGALTVGSLPKVMADHRRLTEIFFVLLSNAIEYRSPDRPLNIRVGARVEAGMNVIDVEDNGIGIDPQYHPRIFDVFQRLHNRSNHTGTGMGLAIARKMADRLGGTISLTSEPDKGCVFSIHLPNPDKTPHGGS